jgi:hypothetical protein
VQKRGRFEKNALWKRKKILRGKKEKNILQEETKFWCSEKLKMCFYGFR